MTAVGWLPAGAEELFGADAVAEESYGALTVDVPPASWITALQAARDRLGCSFFDWLSAVDEPGTGFRVAAHVAALAPVRRLLLRTTVPHDAPALPSAVDVYAGAAWHERETHEMFGVDFTDHPGLDHLLLPDGFEGHPLRKDFVLAARVAKAWPGAKEPGESEHGGPRRRQMLPPGVPDPNEWGPLKGQLPPAPTRPARAAGRTAAAGDRPPRRTRTASQGSAGRPPTGDPTAPPRRSRTAAEGSVSQSAAEEAPATPPRRSRTAAEGSASQAPAGEASGGSAASPRRSRSAAEGSVSQTPATGEAPGGSAAPARRARKASEGSVSQAPAGEASGGSAASPRRSRSAAEGSVSQAPAGEASGRPAAGPRRARTAAEGSVSQSAGAGAEPGARPARRARSASEGSASQRADAPAASAGTDATDGESAPAEGRSVRKPPVTPRSPDAPWHHARPAYTEPERADAPDTAPGPEPDRASAPEPESEPESGGRGQDRGDGAAPDAPAGTGGSPTTGPAPNPEPTDPEDPSGGPR